MNKRPAPLGKCCGRRPSDRLVQQVDAVLRNALQAAVREELVQRNVAKLAQVSGARYEVNRGLTTEQARKLCIVAREDRLYALYVLALYLGLRRGELLGLTWDDIDLDAGRLEVRRGMAEQWLRVLHPVGHADRAGQPPAQLVPGPVGKR